MTTPRALRVVVVGGGIAGISVAAELAPYAAVDLLEQEPTLAHHTTGRSAAMYLPSYGPGPVQALTAASRATFEELSEEAEQPLLSPRGLVYAAGDAAAAAGLGEGSPSVRVISPEDALALVPVLRPELLAGAAMDDSGADIDVACAHAAYLRRFTREGGVVHRSARVTAIEAVGGGWQVTAGELQLRCDVVVNAAGAWADDVAGLAGLGPVGLQPLRRTIFVSPCRAHEGMEGWPLVIDAEEQWYFRPEPGGVLGSPADETPSPPCDARPDELDIALGLERINERTTLDLRSVRSSWAGLRTFAPDRLPVVGHDPRAEGFAWFAGQGGYGIQMAPALARLGASLVLGHPLPDGVPAVAREIEVGRLLAP
jgi:D-arginine dehydrogenase